MRWDNQPGRDGPTRTYPAAAAFGVWIAGLSMGAMIYGPPWARVVGLLGLVSSALILTVAIEGRS